MYIEIGNLNTAHPSTSLPTPPLRLPLAVSLRVEAGGEQAQRAAHSALPPVRMSSAWSQARYGTRARRAYGELIQIQIFWWMIGVYQSTSSLERSQRPPDCRASFPEALFRMFAYVYRIDCRIVPVTYKPK